MTNNPYNCKVRLKSTKDGKITAIYRNNQDSECNRILERFKRENAKQIMITGFNQEGNPIMSISSLDNFGQGLTLIDNLNQFFRANAD